MRTRDFDLKNVSKEYGKFWNSGSVSAATATQQKVTFDSKIDPFNMFTSGTPVVIPTKGIWVLEAQLWISNSGAGTLRLGRIAVNGGGSGNFDDRRPPFGGDHSTPNPFTVLALSKGDIVEISAWQDSGGSLSILGSAIPLTFLALWRIA